MNEIQWKSLIKSKSEDIKAKINEAKIKAKKYSYKKYAVYIWNCGEVCIFEDFKENGSSGYLAEKRNECKKVWEFV